MLLRLFLLWAVCFSLASVIELARTDAYLFWIYINWIKKFYQKSRSKIISPKQKKNCEKWCRDWPTEFIWFGVFRGESLGYLRGGVNFHYLASQCETRCQSLITTSKKIMYHRMVMSRCTLLIVSPNAQSNASEGRELLISGTVQLWPVKFPTIATQQS